MTNDELSIERLIRIETRIARIQDHLGLPTRMDPKDVYDSKFASARPINRRLADIETGVYKLMESMNLNPKTGKKNEER